MAEKEPPVSEGEELDSFLSELERGGAVKEIAGWKIDDGGRLGDAGLYIVKNSAGEKPALRFDFSPPLAKFTEHDADA